MRKDLNSCVGKLFIHTKKAIRHGAPNYRMFCAMGLENSRLLLAWPVDRETTNSFFHPAYCADIDAAPLSIQDLSKLDLCINYDQVPEGLGGVRVMAITTFRPDSFYKQVTLEQAIEKLIPISS